MPPRRPNQQEWGMLQAHFPQLTQGNVWITDGPTNVYNCIAFSLLITNQWINPPQPLAAFQALYNQHGHATCPAGAGTAQIDGWATPQNGPAIAAMTHGSRVTTSSYPGLWESKLGESFRITHGRAELVSAVYGRGVTSFT